MAFRQKARASDRSPSWTLFQAEPFSALARTSIMCRLAGALSDSRSASSMTALASANRPWNSSAWEKITSVRASPEVVAKLAEHPAWATRQALVRFLEGGQRHRERPEPAQRLRLTGQVTPASRRLEREPVQPGAVVPVPAHVVEGPQHHRQPPRVRVEPGRARGRSP